MEPSSRFKNARVDYFNIEAYSRIRFEASKFLCTVKRHPLPCVAHFAMGKGTQGSITLKMANYLSDSTWCQL